MSPEEKLLRAIFSHQPTEEDLDPVYLGDNGIHWFFSADWGETEYGPFDDRLTAQAAHDLHILETKPMQGTA